MSDRPVSLAAFRENWLLPDLSINEKISGGLSLVSPLHLSLFSGKGRSFGCVPIIERTNPHGAKGISLRFLKGG
jgi:hypothetical protein